MAIRGRAGSRLLGSVSAKNKANVMISHPFMYKFVLNVGRGPGRALLEAFGARVSRTLWAHALTSVATAAVTGMVTATSQAFPRGNASALTKEPAPKERPTKRKRDAARVAPSEPDFLFGIPKKKAKKNVGSKAPAAGKGEAGTAEGTISKLNKVRTRALHRES
jgi:hypothetical protein